MNTTNCRAKKIGGSYQADGTIVSTFATLAGETRHVFEFDQPAGMLHIFGPGQVEITHAAAPKVVADERALFEAWANNGNVVHASTVSGWAAWQARAALAAAPVQASQNMVPLSADGKSVWIDGVGDVALVQAQEPVAKYGEDCIFNLRKQANGERWPAGTKLYTAPVQPVAVPDGWQLMPVELTPSMKSILKEAAPKWHAESIYGGLLAEAPAAPSSPATVTDTGAQGDGKDANLLKIMQKAIVWCEDPAFRTEHTAKQMQTFLDGMHKEFSTAIAAKAVKP